MKKQDLNISQYPHLNIYVGFTPTLIECERKYVLPKINEVFELNHFENYSIYFPKSFETKPGFLDLFTPDERKKLRFTDDYESNQIHLAFIFGGDGALLWAHKILKSQENVIYFCFNMGQLGFLTAFIENQLNEVVESVIGYARNQLPKQEILVYSFPQIYGKLRNSKGETVKEFLVINEIVMSRIKSYCPMFEVRWNNSVLASINADGLIVSSSLGSTAYNSSVNGPVILPTSSNYVLSAIAPFGINFRSIVLSADDLMTFKIAPKFNSKEILVSGDSNDEYQMTSDDSLEIGVSERQIRLARYSQNFEEFTIKKIKSVFKWD